MNRQPTINMGDECFHVTLQWRYRMDKIRWPFRKVTWNQSKLFFGSGYKEYRRTTAKRSQRFPTRWKLIFSPKANTLHRDLTLNRTIENRLFSAWRLRHALMQCNRSTNLPTDSSAFRRIIGDGCRKNSKCIDLANTEYFSIHVERTQCEPVRTNENGTLNTREPWLE